MIDRPYTWAWSGVRGRCVLPGTEKGMRDEQYDQDGSVTNGWDAMYMVNFAQRRVELAKDITQ